MEYSCRTNNDKKTPAYNCDWNKTPLHIQNSTHIKI